MRLPQPLKGAYLSVIVIDSGLGGISVVRALRAARRDLALTYIADTAGFPYGGQAAETIGGRATHILRAVETARHPRAVIVACNTLSTLCLAQLRTAFAFPFVGTVPAIKVAGQLSRRFTLLATPNTAHSAYSRDLIARFAGDSVVDRHGAPDLASCAESWLLGRACDQGLLADELAPAFLNDARGKTDTIVLGCTHYPLIVEALKAAAPWEVRWIDSGDAIARRALALAGGLNGESVAYVTDADDVERYTDVFRREGFQRVAALEVDWDAARTAGTGPDRREAFRLPRSGPILPRKGDDR